MKNWRIKLYAFILSGVVVGTYAHHADLIKHGQIQYSALPSALDEQVEALRQGHIALSTHLEDVRTDYVWHAGKVQQIWGLAAPLLMLPFYGAWKYCAGEASPFPGYLFLLLCFAAAVFATTLFAFELNRGLMPKAWVPVISTAVIAGIFLSPAIVNLFSYIASYYEQAVAYNFILNVAAVLGASYFWRAPKPSVAQRILLGILLAFPLYSRLSSVVPVAALWLALIVQASSQRNFRRVALPAASFALAVLVLAACNYTRFGSPISYGHLVSFSENLNGVHIKFGSPFAALSLWRALLETWSLIFLSVQKNYRDFYGQHFFPFQSSIYRFRLFYYDSYSVFDFLALGLIPIAYLKCRTRGSGLRALDVVFLLSLGSFLGLWVFYAKAPAIVSRYLADLNLSIVLAQLGLLYALRVGRDRRVALAALLGLAAIKTLQIDCRDHCRLKFLYDPQHHEGRESSVALEALRQERAVWLGYARSAQAAWDCTPRSEFHAERNSYADNAGAFEVRRNYHIQGWDDISCSVVLGTTVPLLLAGACVDVKLESVNPELLNEIALEARARMDLVELAKMSVVKNGNELAMRWCSTANLGSDQIIYIAWLDPLRSKYLALGQVRLLRIAAVK